MTTDNPEEAQIQRKQSSFSSDRSRFQGNSGANSQYFSLYQARELQLRERVLESCDDRILQSGAWRSAVAAGSIVHLEANQLSYVVGTIYMDMPLKPNVLDEITRESWVAAPPPRSNYRSANDVVILEDSNGRVPLSGESLKKYSLTTGMVCAVLGFEGKDGTFHCQDICFPNYPPPSLLANPLSDIQVDNSLVALCSGLNVSNQQDLLHDLLIAFMVGDLNTPDDIEQVSNISRLILCGNSLALPTAEDIFARTAKDKFGSGMVIFDPAPLKALDDIIHEIGSNTVVDMMSGETDPTSALMPQQPVIRSIFKKSSRYNTFATVSNPYEFISNGTRFLGTSGQNIDNMQLYSEENTRLILAIQTLRCAHIAPTAPDTLLCRPFNDQDPMVLEDLPDIYFIGNQPNFQYEKIELAGKSVLVILVPEFKKTGTIVLVDSKKQECWPITFAVDVT